MTLRITSLIGFCLCGLLVSFAPAEIRESSRLVVMTFNIRYDNPGDGVNRWTNRRAFVGDLIGRTHRPDVLGVQEALFNQVVDLESRLASYGWVGAGRNDGKREGEFSPVFYRRERVEVQGHGSFWLSETPEVPGSKSWDAAITRIVTWARFKDGANGGRFCFFNTHFDHRGRQARQESVRLLREKILSIAGADPFILCGDFNFDESSDEYRRMTVETAGLPSVRDCRYQSVSGHRGPTASFSDWLVPGPPESRIDFIFVSRHYEVLSHRIVDEKRGNRFASDHLPVVAEVQLK